MTDYIVNIGTKFDSESLSRFNTMQQNISSTTKTANKATDAQSKSLDNNAKAANNAANANNKYAMSAKAQAAAMRGVPAQITDIFVSLQGGQRPLTVLMQQGGQLKDMFGGVVPAARALTTSFIGMINPVTVLGAAVLALGAGFYSGRKEMEAINRTILLTGNQAGVSAGAIQAMASEFDNLTGVTKGYATEVINAVVSTRKFSGDSVKAISELALSMQKLTGGELDDMIKQVSSLGDDPVKGVLALNESFLVLTQSQLDEIKAARDSGDMKRASLLAAEALNKGLDGLNQQLESNKNWFDRSTAAAKTWAAEIWDAIKNIGRMPAYEEQITEAVARRQLAYIRLNEAIAEGNKLKENAERGEIALQDSIINKASEAISTTNKQTAATTAANQSVQLLAAAQEKNWAATATKAQKAAREIDAVKVKYKELRAALNPDDTDSLARLNQAELLDIANIEKEYQEKKVKSNDRTAQRLIERQKKYFAELTDLTNNAQNGQGEVRQSISIVNSAETLEAANRRIALIDAERKAYESAGFSMGAYTSVINGVKQASIEMTQAKALELGIIKNSGDVIDETNSNYIKAVDGARKLAAEEGKRAELNQQLRDTSYLKGMNEDLKIQFTEQQLISDMLASGLVPNTKAWDQAMLSTNAQLARMSLEAKGFTGSELDAYLAKLAQVQEKAFDNQQTTKLIGNIEDKMGSAFDAIWENGADGFKSLLAQMAKELVKSALLKLITQLVGSMFGGGYTGNGTGPGSISGFGNNLSNFTYQAMGGAWSKGTQFFADGGVVNRTTPFGMANGGLGVMGEAGPEAIMPLKRGADGKLGVAGSGGTNIVVGPGAVVVNASNDPDADARKTQLAINQLITLRVNEIIADKQRSGNSLNPFPSQRF